MCVMLHACDVYDAMLIVVCLFERPFSHCQALDMGLICSASVVLTLLVQQQTGLLFNNYKVRVVESYYDNTNFDIRCKNVYMQSELTEC